VSEPLEQRVAAMLGREARPEVAALARRLGEEAGALAVLFYGSNLRTGSLEGVLDFYVLLPGRPESGLWPRVSYREADDAASGERLRAKIATMTLAKFADAARGESLDTTIWARFVQPSALLWARDETARQAVADAVSGAARTAARLAAALGPASGRPEDYWRALFRATYRAELRVEKPGRENAILEADPAHFDGLLRAALVSAGVPFADHGARLSPRLTEAERARLRRWWQVRRRMGKPFNLARLVRATATFDGAARYGAWKLERHTGIAIELTPWRERHPILAAPKVLWGVWREMKRRA
jgi:hypothetical protein